MPVPTLRPADRCPGLLRPHHARDGALVRLRVPGGRIDADAFAALRRVAGEYGDGDIHLTSRANVQLRALPVDEHGAVPEPVSAHLRTAGFLPSPSHERVRNIVASPLSGIAGGRADVRGLARALDAQLCADPGLAGLSGRFLFGFDDGRGDLAGVRCDLRAVAEDPGTMRILAGRWAGPRVPTADAPPALLTLARRFLATAGDRWNVRDLPRGGAELLEDPHAPGETDPQPIAYGPLPGGALSVLVPLGIVTPQAGAALSRAAGPDGALTVTPWRGVVIVPGTGAPGPGTALQALHEAGLVTGPGSPWSRISACTGAPGCARSAGDTRGEARRLAARGTPGEPLHVVGCDHACGAPRTPHRLITVRSDT